MPVEAAPPFAVPSARPFGRLPDGREASLFTLEVPGGWQATITDYGAILTSFSVPPAEGDAAGKPVDVVLGFDSLAGYLAGHPYFGATCGRCSNRIAAGRFELAGKTHQLATNNGANHLHGGVEGFDKKLWQATPRATAKGPAVEFERVSPDGEEGYPGRLVAKVVSTLTPAGELIVEMSATSDEPTIVNMVHHSYWNLAGQASGSIKDHELAVEADRYLPVDEGSIPTGAFAPVRGRASTSAPNGSPGVAAAPRSRRCRPTRRQEPPGVSITPTCSATGSPIASSARPRCSAIRPAAARSRSTPISRASRSTWATSSTARSRARRVPSTAPTPRSVWRRRSFPTRSTIPTGRACGSTRARPTGT